MSESSFENELQWLVRFNRKLTGWRWGLLDENLEELSLSESHRYRTIAPEVFRVRQVGTFIDYVEHQREEYEARGLACRTYYCITDQKGGSLTHSVIIVEPSSFSPLVVRTEAAWRPYCGVYLGETTAELLRAVSDQMQPERKPAPDCTVYAYPRPPRFGMSVPEFVEWVCAEGERVDLWPKVTFPAE